MFPTDPAVGLLGCNSKECATAEQGQAEWSFPLQTCPMPGIPRTAPSSRIY